MYIAFAVSACGGGGEARNRSGQAGDGSGDGGRGGAAAGGEFAALIGDYEVEDLYPLPQPDYGDGFQDADGYFELEDCESEFDGYPEPAAGCMAESRRLIPQEIGMRGLDRLLKQRFLKKLYQDRSLAYWEVVLSVRMLLH